ncbi:unnamed protein product, partial [marine sediment metagenome]
DATIENNEITEADDDGGIVFAGGNKGNTISGNTISDNDVSGIVFAGAGSDDNVIEGNTISGNDPNGIEVTGSGTTALVIQGNDITENDDDGILIEEWADSNVIVFNNLVDNDDDAIDNDTSPAVAVDAILNWWGTDDSDDIDTEFEGDVTNDDFEPFLTDTVDAIFTGYNAAAADDELDAEDEAGVVITLDKDADRIKAGAYAANPEGEDPPDPAVAYYDVYVAGGTAAEADIKLYVSGINEDMAAFMWSLATDKWVDSSDTYEVSVSEYGGYVIVEGVDVDDLGG